ncbi:unnamed protein product [Gongylonema pulchrum]|uniref:Tubulin--tyrosine ligase n=1 Tax=Gongylonema pulchrum TaxID=637853 RepID=A0A183E657_9BILA|nr:unnamed protein product [Gongylonema pulchrum]
MSDLSKKISLTRAISSMRQLFPHEYQFYPSSWFIPAQFDAFVEHCNSSRHTAWYIVKPDDGAQGTGIYLIQNPGQIKEPGARQLIQEYITDPYLMGDNLKFDFRVYAVIKSINPLSIYAAHEGMARFCTERYERPTTSNFGNLYAHLTNYSLNKENDAYIHSSSLDDQMKGSKRLLTTVFHQMESRGVKTKYLWHKIKLIIIMGFDILVKKDLEPVLLEVNSAPSLTIEHYLSSNPPDEDAENNELLRVRSVVDEIFPCRYGHSSGHLLFLDKVAYLFMQFVNLKQTTVMTISGARTFLKQVFEGNRTSVLFKR